MLPAEQNGCSRHVNIGRWKPLAWVSQFELSPSGPRKQIERSVFSKLSFPLSFVFLFFFSFCRFNFFSLLVLIVLLLTLASNTRYLC